MAASGKHRRRCRVKRAKTFRAAQGRPCRRSSICWHSAPLWRPQSIPIPVLRRKLFCVDGLDGRSQTARRFRDLVEGMGNDLGGSDRLSEGQKQLIRRAATLSIMSESVEADFIRNLAFDSEAYGVLRDRLRRCLRRLGLERVARLVNDGSNVLSDYFSRPPPKEGAAP